MISKLYYECHVTIEPVFDRRLDLARLIATGHKFKLADLLMQKRKEDTPQRSMNDTFMTAHGKDYQELESRMKSLILELRTNHFEVWRYKIEDTIIDSKIKDELEIL
jgi:hypothetical protein